jgi:hypothetical protein
MIGTVSAAPAASFENAPTPVYMKPVVPVRDSAIYSETPKRFKAADLQFSDLQNKLAGIFSREELVERCGKISNPLHQMSPGADLARFNPFRELRAPFGVAVLVIEYNEASHAGARHE